MLSHMSLFSGIGGIDLAAEWAGFETIGQCEFADFPTKVLEKHWPDVPRWRDVRDVSIESFRQRTGIENLTLLSAGFPCQPHSLAGKRLGNDDERDLWDESNRVIGEIRPEWVLAENVPGLLSTDDGRFFGRVLRDLSKNGYDAWWISIPISAIGGVFEGERVFIIGKAHNESKLQAYQTAVSIGSKWHTRNNTARSNWGHVPRTYWETHQPPVCGVDDGIRQRFYKSRMMALGNMVVPQHVYPILKIIADIERTAHA